MVTAEHTSVGHPGAASSEELQPVHGEAALQSLVVDLQGLLQRQLLSLAGRDDGNGLAKLITHDRRSSLRLGGQRGTQRV